MFCSDLHTGDLHHSALLNGAVHHSLLSGESEGEDKENKILLGHTICGVFVCRKLHKLPHHIGKGSSESDAAAAGSGGEEGRWVGGGGEQARQTLTHQERLRLLRDRGAPKEMTSF